MNFWKNKKILVTGGDGFLGQALIHRLIHSGATSENISIPHYPEDDLLNFSDCLKFSKNINVIFHLAGKVGGILFNQEHPGSMMYENLQMGLNIMEAARINNVQKIINIGTTCSYPLNSPIPLKEVNLWDGYPAEETAPYGLAKKMLLELGRGYHKEYRMKSIFLLPVNLYGPNDHFEGESTHVIPALIKRITDAKINKLDSVTIWGSGVATREFLYVEDAADGIILAAKNYNKSDPVNLGTGIETTISGIVKIIGNCIGFDGIVRWDKSKPDGTLRRCMDVTLAEREFGFKAKTDLHSGIRKTIDFYLDQINKRKEDLRID